MSVTLADSTTEITARERVAELGPRMPEEDECLARRFAGIDLRKDLEELG